MTRSRRRKLQRLATGPRRPLGAVPNALVVGLPLAPMLMTAGAGLAYAQAPSTTAGGLEEIVVTAQKREENLQSVPISIQALGTEKLKELKITQFTDYVKYLPSVSYTSAGPGFSLPYFRGVAIGENGNHSGPSPSVGIYLDEQPITTIQGALDVHIYDVARVEALAGPQGTLYGASSQAGTIRIITNKPDPTGFEAGYGVEGSYVQDGEAGYLFEGFVNLPISEAAAVRLVGWVRHDPGYIDNVEATRTFPTSGACITNSKSAPAECERTWTAEDDFNYVDTYGGRAALRVDLGDNWSITPSLMAQSQDGNGSFAYDPARGDLETAVFYPTLSKDRFVQAALTVEGKIGNFDVTYGGAFLNRDDVVDADYSDYAVLYDQYYVDYCAADPTNTTYCDDAGNALWGQGFFDNDGNVINPGQFIQGSDAYEMQTHELRIASPTENRFRFIGGLFWQDFEHKIYQRYMVRGIADEISVTGWEDTLWLTNQLREDKSQAVFGELSFDFTEKLSGTAGLRYYEYDNSLYGFFGFGPEYQGSFYYGESSPRTPCSTEKKPYNGTPCIDLDANVDDSGTVPKVNFTYRFDDRRLAYLTYSEGFRPGGVNRNDGTIYDPDTLNNYELGWKTTWADGRVRLNGAVFHEEWDGVQYSYLPPGGVGLTVIRNVGAAEIDGIEMDIGWAPIDNLTLSAGFLWVDAALTEDYQPEVDAEPEALEGDQLPVTPDLKANVTGRYEFPLGDFAAYTQGAVVYTGDSYADLTRPDRAFTGVQDAYTVVDLAFGIRRESWTVDLFLNNAFDERGQAGTGVSCAYFVCGPNPYYYPNRPRTVGLKFTQEF
jgi:iron complex outermembrane receptor protein